jgi:nucleolin
MPIPAEGEDATRAALQEVFGECGEVVNIRLPSDRESGELKGIAYIEFGSADAKDKAGELNGSEAAGGYLKVDVNVAPRTPGGGGGFGGGRGGGFGGRGGGGFGGRGGGRGGDRGELLCVKGGTRLQGWGCDVPTVCASCL